MLVKMPVPIMFEITSAAALKMPIWRRSAAGFLPGSGLVRRAGLVLSVTSDTHCTLGGWGVPKAVAASGGCPRADVGDGSGAGPAYGAEPPGVGAGSR